MFALVLELSFLNVNLLGVLHVYGKQKSEIGLINSFCHSPHRSTASLPLLY